MSPGSMPIRTSRFWLTTTKDGSVRALMSIAGRPAQLICVYVERRMQLGFVPQVLYIDFFGRALDDGQRVVGRLTP